MADAGGDDGTRNAEARWMPQWIDCEFDAETDKGCACYLFIRLVVPVFFGADGCEEGIRRAAARIHDETCPRGAQAHANVAATLFFDEHSAGDDYDHCLHFAFVAT